MSIDNPKDLVVYVVQRLFMNDVWVNLASFLSINDAKKCLEMRSVGKKKYRIVKRIKEMVK